jgi:hypothetical protein
MLLQFELNFEHLLAAPGKYLTNYPCYALATEVGRINIL